MTDEEILKLVDNLVEIEIEEGDFLKIKETLTRIGIGVIREGDSDQKNTLYQSCHIFQKRGRYYLVHFKELFALDGKSSNFDETDRGRRNTIAALLEEWKLLKVVDKTKIEEPRAAINHIKIIPYAEKDKWELIPKYMIGKKAKIKTDNF